MKLISTSLLTACLSAISLGWAGSASAATELREVGDFAQVKYALPYTVEFVAADRPYVELQGDEDVIEDIVTGENGDQLRLYEDRSWFNWSGRSKDDVVITVGYVTLDAITMTGSGDGYAAELDGDEFKLALSGSGRFEVDTLNANDLDVLLTGSGRLQLHDIEVDTVHSRLTGSGNIHLEGGAHVQELNITGSGNVRAQNLRSQETQVKVQGSGDAELWAELSLQVSILGSGNVTYRGDPEVEKRVTGSGRLKRNNSR